MSDTVLSAGSTSSYKLVKPSKKSTVGIAFQNEKDGSISVANIRDNGLASKTGLRVGDRVTEVNGVPMDDKTSKDAANLIRKSQGEVTITAQSFDEMPIEEIATEDEMVVTTDEEGERKMIFPNEAGLSSFPLGFIIVVLQVVAVYNLYTFFDYGNVDTFTTQEYIIYRDIMVMH